MKKLALLISTILAFSCSEVNDLTPSMDNISNISVLVAATQPSEESSSRISLSDNGSSGYSIYWSKDDKLGGWSSSSTKFSEFSISEWSDECSTFEGSITGASSSDNIRFVYPFLASTSISSSKFAIDLSSQTSSGDLSNLSSSTYMVSNSFLYGDAGKSSVAMYHVGAVVDLQIKTKESGLWLTGVTIVGSDGLEIPTSATIDLTQEIDEILSVAQSGEITIEASSPIAANSSNVYALSFNTIPFDITKGQSVTVVATFEDSEGKSYEGTNTITAGSLTQFKRATRNGINVTFDELAADSGESLVATLDSSDMASTSYSDFYFTSENITFYCEQGRSNSGSLNIPSSKMSFLYNSDAISGLSKIVVKLNSSKTSSIEFYICSGSSVNPTANSTTYSNSAGVYTHTYTPSSGCEYFTIVASTGSVYIDSIEIYATK